MASPLGVALSDCAQGVTELDVAQDVLAQSAVKTLGYWCLISRHLLQGMETKPAPGDAGTDSGTDDEAKLQSAAEQGLRIHRSRKAEIMKQKLAAPECTSQAAEAGPAQAWPHRAAPESAGKSCLPPLYPCLQVLFTLYMLCSTPECMRPKAGYPHGRVCLQAA